MQTATLTASQPKINRQILSNGLTLITVSNPSSQVIAGRIFLKNTGSRWEKREKAGLSHLLGSVITKGAESLSAMDIAYQIESLGASLGAESTSDYFLMGLKTVDRDFLAILNLAARIMRSPTFPDQEVELEKNLALQSIRSQKESPFNLAFNKLRESIYGEHPYSLSVLGTEATVEKLTPADLQAYHQTHFRPDQLVISFSGNLDPETARQLVEEFFGDWQNPDNPLPELELPVLTAQPKTVYTPENTQQSIIMLGYLTPGVAESDYMPLKLINTYLGNGLSSRLFVELREKRGLAYDVSAFFPTRIHQSSLVAYMGTAPENRAIAQAGLESEVKRLSNTLLSEAELQVAKNKLLGQYALGKQANSEIAQIYGWYETLGLGISFEQAFPEKIQAVTPELVQGVAQKYLQQAYVSLVGPDI